MSVPLASVSPSSGSTPGLITMQQPAWKNANVFLDATTNQPGIWSFWQVTWFENALQFLDQPGEWYLDQDAGYLYYMPAPRRGPAPHRGRGTAARPDPRGRSGQARSPRVRPALRGSGLRLRHVAAAERTQRLRVGPERLPPRRRGLPAEHHRPRAGRRAHARQRQLQLRAPHHVPRQRLRAPRRRRPGPRDRLPGLRRRGQPLHRRLVCRRAARRHLAGRRPPDSCRPGHP